MDGLTNPLVFLALSGTALWLSALIGAFVRRSRGSVLEKADRQDLAVVLGAALALLGLAIAFSFSMAVSRYDRRKSCEEDEANAVGTEYLRAGLLSSSDAVVTRKLLTKYLGQRILFYETNNSRLLEPIAASTAQLQMDLWSAVEAPATRQPTAVAALTLSGMNDVLSSQQYTQAAWQNRIPGEAWMLMLAIAVCCNVLFGYNARHANYRNWRFLVLPFVVSVSLTLITDIDNPRGGLIQVTPQNLLSLSDSLQAR
jgi:hypothetical protein